MSSIDVVDEVKHITCRTTGANDDKIDHSVMRTWLAAIGRIDMRPL